MQFQLKHYLVTTLLILLMPLAQGHIFSKRIDLSEPNLPAIRKLLIAALDSKKTTDSLYSNLESIKNRSALLTGYMGALEALKAKHTWNPYFKIKYLNDCEKTLAKAVTRDPHNIEIRFMRFSIEHNVPNFLGYNNNLVTDRQEIIRQVDNQYYAQADKLLVKTIISFLIESKRCTLAEITDLKNT